MAAKIKHLKKVAISFALTLFVSTTFACDICGCGLGNYYIGLVPQFNRKFFGLRYQFSSFHTQLAADKTQYSSDYFKSVELWGGFNIGRKWQVLFFVPYSFTRQISDDGAKQSHGLGDIATILNYSLLESSSLNKNNKMVFQQLWVGGGLKLPTGKSAIDPLASDLVALANSQLGTGSTDFILNSSYSIHIDKLGFSSNALYKINTSNKEAYRFGNRFSSNNFIFYSLKAKTISITPDLGLLYEHTAANHLKSEKAAQTGGYAGLGAVGVEVGSGNISFGGNMQIPVVQNFAEGQTTGKIRGMLHVTLSL